LRMNTYQGWRILCKERGILDKIGLCKPSKGGSQG
jgi:hypothetical protein